MKKISLRLLLCGLLISLLFINQAIAQKGGKIQPQVVGGAPNPPGPITGPTSAAPSTTSQYSVPPIVPGITLSWRLTPATAGSLSYSVNQATVTWSSAFTGSATLSCTATNSYGSSAPSNLVVTATPPVITCSITPASQVCGYNKVPAMLKGTVSGGSSYTYQWQSSTNNVTWTPISGAIGINYTPVALTANSYYQLVATSGGVSAASNSATVIINQATNPANVDTTFSNAMVNIFGTLNTANIPTGLLRDAGFELTNLENYNGTALVDSNFVDAEVLRTIYATLASARMTNTSAAILPGASSIDSTWFSLRKPGQVTLCGLFYQYSYLNTSVNPNPNITITNGQLFDKYVNGVWQNPYLQGQTIAFAPASPIYQALNFNLVLPAGLWFTNNAGSVSQIQVDAGDGLGYRTLTPGSPLAVNYNVVGLKLLNFKLMLTNGTILQSHSQITVTGSVDNSTCWGPDCSVYNPPGRGGGGDALQSVANTAAVTTLATQTISPDKVSGSMPAYYFRTGAKFNGMPAEGKITIQLVQGRTSIVNPLIIVEGFDEGYYTTPESYAGTASLYGLLNNNMANSPALYNEVVSNYDIIYVNFRNGTDDIHRNALLVASVIRWVNQYKTGTSKNVVLGLSMGGLCARYALKTMENNGETHQVGLFICHGTPQQGAVLPLGLQAGNYHLNSLYTRAFIGARANSGTTNLYNNIEELFHKDNRMPNYGGLLSLNDSPAALQMEINHLNSNYQIDNSVHNAWQSELSALGYPSQGGIKIMAISNGSECGQGQGLTQGGTILSFNANASTSIIGDILAEVGGPLAAVATGQPSFLLSVIPGRNAINAAFQVNAEIDGGGNLGYSGKITYQKKVLWLIPVSVTVTNRTFTNPSGVLPYETFGGDNMPLPNLTYTATPEWLGKYNIQMAYSPAFGFVPTTSILDIGLGKTTLVEGDYSLPYTAASPPAAPKNTPFSNFITSFSPISDVPNSNEAHISYETRNGNWLAGVLIANRQNTTPPVADCTALCQINAITGDSYNCTNLKPYSVPSFANVTYTWSKSSNLQIVSGQGTNTVQVQPLSGTNGQKGTLSLSITSTSNPECGTQYLSKEISIGIEPLVVNSTVDRTPQSSHYQYLTATATQLANTTASNYTWWLMVNSQPTTQIGNGLTLRNYPMAPGTTIFYQCQAVTPCGISTYNGYAYNDYAGGSGLVADQSVVIYPNPADETMSVTNNSVLPSTDVSGNAVPAATTDYSLVILDNFGKTLISKQNKNGNATITFNTANIANGTYFLHIKQGSKVVKKQIIISHK